MKTCRVCLESLSKTEEFFFPRKDSPDGFRSECRTCWSLKCRENYLKNRVARGEAAKAWVSRNVEKQAAYMKKYAAENRVRGREIKSAWKKSHPLQSRKDACVRKSRELNAEGSFTTADIAVLYDTQFGCCHWCGEELFGVFENEHIVPLSRGGTNWPDNLCCSCRTCNRRKGFKLPHEWLTQAGSMPHMHVQWQY